MVSSAAGQKSISQKMYRLSAPTFPSSVQSRDSEPLAKEFRVNTMVSGGHASGNAVIGTVVTFSVLSYICVALRVWTRFRIQRQPGIDDALIVISTVFNVVMCLCMIMQVHYGLGRHIETITPPNLEEMMFWFWLSIWTYYGAQGFGKLSILFQYLRIFGRVQKFRKICYWSMALCIFYLAWGVITSIVICHPVDGFWHLDWQSTGRATCLPKWRVKVPIWFFNAALNMTTDVLIAVIPLPVIKTLHLPKKQRIMLMGVFCLGGFVCIVSIIRLTGLYAIAISEDPSWDNPQAALWSATEANFTAIASCLPVIKGLQAARFPNLFGTTSTEVSNTEGSSASTSKRRGIIWGKRETEIEVLNIPVDPLQRPPNEEERWEWMGRNDRVRNDSSQVELVEMLNMEKAEGEGSSRFGRRADVEMNAREIRNPTSPINTSNRGAWRGPVVDSSGEATGGTQSRTSGSRRDASLDSREIFVPTSPLDAASRRPS